jgi:hypothetical protein
MRPHFRSTRTIAFIRPGQPDRHRLQVIEADQVFMEQLPELVFTSATGLLRGDFHVDHPAACAYNFHGRGDCRCTALTSKRAVRLFVSLDVAVLHSGCGGLHRRGNRHRTVPTLLLRSLLLQLLQPCLLLSRVLLPALPPLPSPPPRATPLLLSRLLRLVGDLTRPSVPHRLHAVRL